VSNIFSIKDVSAKEKKRKEAKEKKRKKNNDVITRTHT